MISINILKNNIMSVSDKRKDIKSIQNKFTDKDVIIYDKEGNKLSSTDKVKITGLVTYTAKGPKKETKSKFGIKPNVDFNKKKDDDGNDYTYTVTNVVIEKL